MHIPHMHTHTQYSHQTYITHRYTHVTHIDITHALTTHMHMYHTHTYITHAEAHMFVCVFCFFIKNTRKTKDLPPKSLKALKKKVQAMEMSLSPQTRWSLLQYRLYCNYNEKRRQTGTVFSKYFLSHNLLQMHDLVSYILCFGLRKQCYYAVGK